MPIPWRGAELVRNVSWRYTLGDADLAEIDACLAACPASGDTAMPVPAFDAPRLSALFRQVDDELSSGTGVAKIAGLPVERYSPHQLSSLFLGLGANLGRPTDQNGARGYLREIRDRSDAGGRRVDSADALNWHNDRTDIVGLLCVQEAATGGVSKIASATAIHNLMLERCPALLDTLFEDFHRYAPGDEVGGTTGRYAVPVFRMIEGRLCVHYSRTYIDQAARLPGATPLGDRQSNALDSLVAAAEELRYEMPLRRGEMQFLNNYAILHGRTAFVDGADDDAQRLLLRIWLASPGRGEWVG